MSKEKRKTLARGGEAKFYHRKREDKSHSQSRQNIQIAPGSERTGIGRKKKKSLPTAPHYKVTRVCDTGYPF